MRCYFMKDGRIVDVHLLDGESDEAGIAQAQTLFDSLGEKQGADAFEVWEETRFIHRFEKGAQGQGQAAAPSRREQLLISLRRYFGKEKRVPLVDFANAFALFPLTDASFS